MYKKIIFIAVVLFTIISCDKKAFDPGATKAVKVANEWWVNYYVDGENQYKYTKLTTYNVSANNDSIWVDDSGNFWDIKVRAKFDAKALTFQTTNAQNEYYDSQVTITEGKIMPNMGKSPSGAVCDSIYLKIEYSDDPGTIYEVKGNGRSMWGEDDY